MNMNSQKTENLISLLLSLAHFLGSGQDRTNKYKQKEKDKNIMNKILAVNLYKSLKEVKRTKMSTLPILNHIKMQFTNGELVITSTDLETSSQAKCPAIMNEEWETCVNMIVKCDTSNTIVAHWHKFYPFLDFVKLHAEYEDVLEFTFNPDIQMMYIKIQGERSQAEFKCMDAMEFPAIAETLL